MAEGNGFDTGSLYGLLVEIGKAVSRQEVSIAALQDEVRQMRTAMVGLAAAMATKADLAEVKTELKAEIAELRQTVELYHGSVVGQGIITSELDARMGRVEQHLGLPPFVHV